MSASVFDYSSSGDEGPFGSPIQARPRRRPPFARTALAAVVLAAVLAAGAVTGPLYAFGVAGASTTSSAAAAGASASGSGAPATFNAASIYGAGAPGVVAITATGVSSSSTGSPSGQTETADTGTGFEIDSSGDILTASHVVVGASSITVKFQNGTVRTASILGTDRSTDVSVLHVNPSGLTRDPLPLGSTQSLVVGDPVAVIGDPFGYNRSLSTGVVSALDRTIQAPDGFAVAHAIQTDAPINPGNSGGPVLDAQGQVVGIVDQIATGSSTVDSNTGIGFAIPVDLVRSELSQLEAGEHVTHAYLGASTAQAALNTQGALVAGVEAGSPAAGAGLEAGDVITSANGVAVTGPSGLVAEIAALEPGDRLALAVTRGSSTLALTATLTAQPNRAATSG
jgi:putative serine protease PepD